MRFIMDGYRRKSLRRHDHEYDRANVYFITTRTFEHAGLFGHLAEDGLHINDAGRMIIREWTALGQRFSDAQPGAIVVLPDHIHGIIAIAGVVDRTSETVGVWNSGSVTEQEHCPTPDDGSTGPPIATSLPRTMQAFKSLTTRLYSSGVREHGWPEFNGKVWQRNYHERIVRTEEELAAIVEYIRLNPKRLWEAAYGSRQL